MTVFVFSNNASTTLAGPIAASATTFSVASGTGSLFPVPGTGQQFALTFISQLDSGQREIVYCTSRTSDSFTVVRGQEGTIPTAFVAGDSVNNFLTAGTTAAFTQATQLQAEAGNYATDTGSVNAIVASYTPAPASLSVIVGAPFRVKIANTNTGAATFANSGLAATIIKNPDGSAIAAGQLPAGAIAGLIYDGTQYQLTSVQSFRPGFSHMVAYQASTTWVVPSGVYTCKGKGWGGGGGGGGSSGTLGAGSGGGGGGYFEGIFGVTPGTTVNITVGAGGTGGTGLPTAGANGGRTQFLGGTAAGGIGGNGGANFVQTASSAGGNATGGALTITGQAGSTATGGLANGGLLMGVGGGTFCNGNTNLGSGFVATAGTPGNYPGSGGNGGILGGAGGNGGYGLFILEY